MGSTGESVYFLGRASFGSRANDFCHDVCRTHVVVFLAGFGVNMIRVSQNYQAYCSFNGLGSQGWG